MSWNLQQINAGGRTSGPPSVGSPFVSVYGSQQHVGYLDGSGNIWDSWYDGNGHWNLQKINNDGQTNGPAAVIGPFIGTYGGQQHFAYLDRAGNLWDSWYDGSGWNLQKINNGGRTSGAPALTGGVASWVSIWTDSSGHQQHFTYLAVDGGIYDAFWNSDIEDWRLQKVNEGGLTGGPPASSSPFGCLFGSQQHVAYQDVRGDIYDSWFDGNRTWSLQQLNNGQLTDGPPAAGGIHPFVWVDPSGKQQHFAYVGNDGAIYDLYWDSDVNDWFGQKITLSNITDGPASVSSPFACVFNQQQHIGYRDSAGNFWDSWYGGSRHWSLQKINNGGMTKGPPAASDVYIWVDSSGDQQHFTYADGGGVIWDAFWQTD